MFLGSCRDQMGRTKKHRVRRTMLGGLSYIHMFYIKKEEIYIDFHWGKGKLFVDEIMRL